jgi:hypothetical protein
MKTHYKLVCKKSTVDEKACFLVAVFMNLELSVVKCVHWVLFSQQQYNDKRINE